MSSLFSHDKRPLLFREVSVMHLKCIPMYVQQQRQAVQFLCASREGKNSIATEPNPRVPRTHFRELAGAGAPHHAGHVASNPEPSAVNAGDFLSLRAPTHPSAVLARYSNARRLGHVPDVTGKTKEEPCHVLSNSRLSFLRLNINLADAPLVANEITKSPPRGTLFLQFSSCCHFAEPNCPRRHTSTSLEFGASRPQE